MVENWHATEICTGIYNSVLINSVHIYACEHLSRCIYVLLFNEEKLTLLSSNIHTFGIVHLNGQIFKYV